MKLKLIIAAVSLLVVALVPLQAQETPTPAPFLFTNTPTRSTTAATATPAPISDSEQVIADLPDRTTFEGQRFQIVGLEFTRTGSSLGKVLITVKNVSDTPASGLVWYLLAPPDVTEPWNHVLYAAGEQLIVDLTAQESRTFVFDGPPSDLIGEVRISAWVHQIQPDGTVAHSDGIGYDQTLVLASSVYLSIEHVDLLPTETGETIVFVTMKIHNVTDVLTEVGYSFTLSTPDDPTPWETGMVISSYQTLLLLPNQEIEVTMRSTGALTSDSWQVIGWLEERVGREMQFRNNDAYP